MQRAARGGGGRFFDKSPLSSGPRRTFRLGLGSKGGGQARNMAGRRRAPYWTFAVVASFLLRQSAGFLCTGSAGCTGRTRAASDPGRFNGCSTLRERCRTTRPEGVGGLRAALEVEPVRDLEMGSVLVAGADNYGHMTFKVSR